MTARGLFLKHVAHNVMLVPQATHLYVVSRCRCLVKTKNIFLIHRSRHDVRDNNNSNHYHYRSLLIVINDLKENLKFRLYLKNNQVQDQNSSTKSNTILTKLINQV